MKILDLPLKAVWYLMIESGVKKEIKEYWIKRLAKCRGHNSHAKTGFWCKKANSLSCVKHGDGFHPEEYTHVRFRYGYTRRTMLFNLDSISIGKGKPDWGAPDKEVFVLRLGEKIE